MSHANAAPPPITPDAKDWTWVLDEQCPDCGFDTAAFDRADVAPMLRDNAGAWQSLLVEAPNVRDRPRPDHHAWRA